jgi:hypothetical protein
MVIAIDSLAIKTSSGQTLGDRRSIKTQLHLKNEMKQTRSLINRKYAEQACSALEDERGIVGTDRSIARHFRCFKSVPRQHQNVSNVPQIERVYEPDLS